MQRQAEEIHLLDYWRIVNSKRHIVISFFILVVGVVAVYSFAATPLYQSTAKLLVNQENNTTLTFAEGNPQIQIKDPTEYYNTQKKILFSRTFMDRVVRKHGLDKNPYFVEKKRKAASGVVASLMRFTGSLFSGKPADPGSEAAKLAGEEADPWLTSLLLSRMKVDLGRDSSIMEIHFSSDNPGVAASAANYIAAAYIEYNLDLRLTPYRNSVEWLTGRLSELKSKMEESEKKLQKYKEQKGIISQEAKENILTQKLQGLVTELVKVQGMRQDAEVKYTQIRNVVDKPELLATVPDIMNSQVIQGLRNEELTLRRQLSDLEDKYGPKHPLMIKATSELESVRKSLVGEARKMLNAAKTEYEIALNREKFLNRSVDEEKREVLGLSREMIDFKVVSEESENNRRFYEMLLKKLQEATLLSGVTVSNMQIIDTAIPPGQPVKPDRSKNLLLAVVIGLFGGVFLAIFADYMDDSVKSQDDVDTHLGQHFLGLVPSAPDMAMFSDPQSTISEAYRTIRMGLKFAASQRPLKTILVTSAIPNEGKTTTAANLGLALSQMGERILLVDADLRRQSMHKYFNLDNTTGLGSVIVEQGDVFAAIKRVEGHPHLSVLSAGPTFPNPSEVLSSEGMKTVLASLRDKFDAVIIDSPPIMPVSDPLVLSGLVDGVVLVARGGSTSRAIAKKACQSLEKMQAHIIGVVMNNVKIPKGTYGYYYYSYYRPYGEGRKDRA